MNQIITSFIVALGKLLSWTSKTFKFGSGTSVPGYLIERYFPSGIKFLASGYEKVIMISGTNGKTTTRALINKVLTDNNIKVVSNFGGANIYRGIATSLLMDKELSGENKSKIAVLEVEEATLPKLTKYMKPDTLVLTNIFRDQLDAYGEIDQTLDYFAQTLSQSNAKLIINWDDKKLCSYLSNYIDNSIGFSLDTPHKPAFEGAQELNTAPSKIYSISDINGSNPIHATINIDDKYSLKSPLPGEFNLYNIIAALSAVWDITGPQSIASIERFDNVFGRGEKITVGSTNYHLFLVKNPAGFQEVLKHLGSLKQSNLNVSMSINDNVADGRDVSWLWDVDFEQYMEPLSVSNLHTMGTRGLDMLLRLEYAGENVSINDNSTISEFVSTTKSSGETWYCLSTYTALLELRKELGLLTSIEDINSSKF